MAPTTLAPRRVGLATPQRQNERTRPSSTCLMAIKRERCGSKAPEGSGEASSMTSSMTSSSTLTMTSSPLWSTALAALVALSPPLLAPPPPASAASADAAPALSSKKKTTTPTSSSTTAAVVKYLTREEISTVELFRRASPSVVFVTALGERRDALTLQAQELPQGAGSGVSWDRDHVVTNFHVVKDAKDIRVTVPDPRGRAGGGGGGGAEGGGGKGGGGEFRARLVGADPERDVAVLEVAAFEDPSEEELEKLEEEKLKAEQASAAVGSSSSSPSSSEREQAAFLPVASSSSSSSSSSSASHASDSSSSSSSPTPPSSLSLPRRKRPPLVPLRRGTSAGLEVGQTVFAIGNPFGLSSTLTKGVLSGVGREIPGGITGRPLENILQTDAAINPGSSGGALLDSSGAMIGINTAIYSTSGGSDGIGFAIPIDSVASSVSDLLEHGRVVRPVLGIALAPEQASDVLGVKGVLVLEARAGGPAASAGVRGTTRDRYGRVVFGDVIRRFEGAPVRSPNDLYRALERATVGEEVELSLVREGVEGEVKVKVTLGASSSS